MEPQGYVQQDLTEHLKLTLPIDLLSVPLVSHEGVSVDEDQSAPHPN